VSLEYGALLDAELLLMTLLDDALPGVGITVAAELDISSINDTPMVVLHMDSGDQERNGPGLWSAFVTVSVFAISGSSGWDACVTVYDTIHDWAMPGSDTPLGHVVRVTDTSSFTRSPVIQMQGKNVTQWTALFELTLREAISA
jgi:hypothetical protein